MSPSQIEEKYAKIVTAWEAMRPNKSFAGMTLAEFKDKIQPSLDKRKRLAELENQRIALASERDHADKTTLEFCEFVVNSIKGDPTEGSDGALYEACGYVRKSERKSGLSRPGTRKRKSNDTTGSVTDKAA